MKLLIVDDQVSSQFKLVEHLKECDLSLNSDIRIASNGLEAIAIVEQHDLDLILMDLQMPVMDGLTTTKKIISKYPGIKIIIITSVDDKLLVQKSMKAGARGYLFKENILNLSSVIQNVSEGYNVFPNYKNHKSNNTNLFFDSDSTVLPSKSDRILKINQIIASKIINTWIDNAKEYIFSEENWWHFLKIDPDNRQDTIDCLLKGDSDKCTLVEELELRYEQLVVRHIYDGETSKDNLENELGVIICRLNYWFDTERVSATFSGFKSRLEANAQILRINYAKNLKKHIDSLFSKTSPMRCLEHLESIEALLNSAIKEYQDELDQFVEQEKSVYRAYDVLIDILKRSEDRQSQQETIASLTRAIFHVYRTKLKIEAYSLAISTFEGIVRILRFSIDDLILAIGLLTAINSQLDVYNIDESISLFVQSKLDTLTNSGELLQEIELEIGYSINQWGVRGCINSSLVLDKLLSKISTCGNNILECIERELYI